MPSYFLGFDIYTRSASGAQVPHAAFQSVQVYNLTLGAAETSLVSNVNGHISTQASPVAAGTKLRFSLSPYSPTIERTTVATLADIENHFESQMNLVLSDSYTPPASRPAFVEIYAVVDGKIKNAILVGKGRSGDVLQWHFPAEVSRDVRFYRVPVAKGGAGGVMDLSTMDYEDFEITDFETITTDGSILARKFVTVSSLTAIEIYMPAAPAENQIHHIKNVGAGVCTVRRSGTQQFFTTAAANNLTLYTGDAYWCRWTGTRWEVY